ncbi:MAG TPA: hypothetical protein VLJ80_06810 [Solirubrobacteraceae bacterium]|nr:hypothetical protein [Solirubrobacteraceae bacterium]
MTTYVTAVIRCRRLAATTLCALGLVGAATAASPSSAAAAISLPPGGVTELSASEGVAVLGDAQLGEGGVPLSALETPVLVGFFAGRPGISDLAGLSALGGAEGVEQALTRAIEQLADDGLPVEELVGPWELALDFEEQLEAAYEESEAAEQPGAPETLEELVEQELGRTPAELIDEGTSPGLGELLSVWLGEAADPAALTGALFATVDPTEVEGLAEAELGGQPFTLADVAETAAAVEMTAAELAQALGQTTSELPEAARALLAPLSDGRWLGLFVGGKGLSFAAFGPPPQEEPVEEPEEEAEEESGEEEGGGLEEGEHGGGTPPPGEPAPGGGPSGGGSSGGTSTPGAGQGPVAATASSAPASVATSPTPAAPATLARVKILKNRPRGATLRLVLAVPSAGTLVLRGKGLRTVRHTSTGARRITIELHATSAVAASVRSHRRVKIKLQASFTPSVGAVSSAAATVVLG